VRDDDCARPAITHRDAEHLDESGAHPVREVLVELLGVGATDVVGLDDRVEVSHSGKAIRERMTEQTWLVVEAGEEVRLDLIDRGEHAKVALARGLDGARRHL
jgi:hypothetical protein